MTKELNKEFNDTFDELSKTISSFTDENFNTIPFEGSWTGAQTVEHIVKSASGIREVLNGPVEKTDRKADEKVDMLKKTFLDFNTKFTSPEFIEPSKDKHSKKEFLDSISNLKESANKLMEEKDLNNLYTLFSLPGSGEFTGIEWFHFVMYHTQRHTHQLKNILKELK
jgi:hypothetical protein